MCPRTHQTLVLCDGRLVTEDGRHAYPLSDGVPRLLSDPAACDAYLSENDATMVSEYRRLAFPSWRSKLHSMLARDFRTKEATDAFAEAIERQPADALCLSIGGGPTRAHPSLVNINIAAFANVDVVADAYALPYADGSVSAVHCEAVLEHLEYPDTAVAEIWRVLRKGGQVFAATPFLQWFHGYPNHFQNFTLIGHERLFTRRRFTIVSSGSCVGPTYALSTLLKCYVGLYVPFRMVRVPMNYAATLFALGVRPLDRWVGRSPRAHVLASTTFVHAIKS